MCVCVCFCMTVQALCNSVCVGVYLYAHRSTPGLCSVSPYCRDAADVVCVGVCVVLCYFAN